MNGRSTTRLVMIASALLVACGGNKVEAPTKSASDVAAASAPSNDEAATPTAQRVDAAALFANSLHADLVQSDAPVKLDGILKEWPARVVARDVVQGSQASGASFGAAVQYDASRIYFAGEVADTNFVRTARFGDEDRASLVLAFPYAGSSGAGYSATEIAFYAGKPGESEGEVRFASGARKGQQVAGAKIVEAVTAGGYTFEASIPWATFAEARFLRVGMRAAARYYDANAPGSITSIVATSGGDAQNPSALAPFPTEAEQSIIEGLLAPKGLATEAPKFDIFADVAGDAMKERISVYGHFFTICGPTYRNGKEFFYRDLNADVLHLDARDLTGDGKDDLVLQRRFTDSKSATTRDSFEVWSFASSDEPTTVFAHEIAIANGAKRVVDSVHASKKEIDVSYEPATGWDASTFREPVSSDVDAILLPWGAIKSQTYRFDGKSFVKSREVAQTPAPNAQPTTTIATAAPSPAIAVDVKTPNTQPAGDLSSRLFDQYKIDHNIAANVQPRIDLRAQLAGDKRQERLVVVDRDIVVFGPGYLDGRSYAFMTLSQFEGARDIKDVTTRDVTGDGNADIVVRGVRRVDAADGAVVEMETLFLYEVRPTGIARIFAIETARERGANRVQGLVQFVPARSGHGFEIDVRPGTAKGWNATSYPWNQDAPGSGALEPLLLPWGKIGELRYVWNGQSFTRK
jgi:hypothetical protein